MRWVAGLLVVAGLLSAACDAPTDSEDSGHAASTPSLVVLENHTDDLTTGEVTAGWAPAGNESPAARAVIASPVPTPERAAEAVAQLETPVALALGSRVRLSGTGWVIGFSEVLHDSRCPVDVRCIWAGQVVVRLVGEHVDGRVAALTLTLPAGGSKAGVLGDLRVEALEVEPSPRAGAPQPSSYVLWVRIGVAPVPSPVALSGVRGVVTIGPMCPVMRIDQPCPDRPYRTVLVVRDPAGREVARVESSDAGAYALALPPGSYVMAPQSPGEARLPRASSEPFVVSASTWVTLDVAYDSGIR